MAKKSKEKWEPKEGEAVFTARTDGGYAWASKQVYSKMLRVGELSAGLIYRTETEAIACAKAMLKAAKEYKQNGQKI